MKKQLSTSQAPLLSFHTLLFFTLLILLGCFKEEPEIPTRIFNKPTWTQKLNFEYDLAFPVCFSIGEKGYMGLGEKAIFDIDDGSYLSDYTKEFWEYDPQTDTWSQIKDFEGESRTQAVGFSIGNKGYIGVGEGQISDLKDFWEYDPADNEWTKKTDFKGSARYGAVGFSIGGKGYIGLGYDEDDIWEYEPSDNSWSPKANFPIEYGIYQAAYFVIGDKGYVGTGVDNTTFELTNSFWEFDPKANDWTQKDSFLGDPRAFAIGFSICGRGYIGLGIDSDDPDLPDAIFGDFWSYDPQTNKWESSNEFPDEPRFGVASFVVSDKAYVGCGSLGDLLNGAIYKKDFWEYTVK